MKTAACENCGHSLFVNQLTGEIEDCKLCGATAQPATPDPEHQVRIDRQKLFELGIVVVIVLVGFGYYSISTRGTRISGGTPITTVALADVLESRGFSPVPESDAFGRSIVTYANQADLLSTTVDIVSNSDTESIETIVMVAGLPPGVSFPPDDVAEPAIQKSFDELVELSEAMIPDCTEALSRATATVVRTGNPGLTYDKGVAQTHDGWKVTYIAWREYEETSEGIPLIALIHQRLDIEPEPDFEAFNRALYRAINDARDVKLTLSERADETLD